MTTLVCSVLTKNTANIVPENHLFPILLIQKGCRYKQLLILHYALAYGREKIQFSCLFLFPLTETM